MIVVRLRLALALVLGVIVSHQQAAVGVACGIRTQQMSIGRRSQYASNI